ncbi:hypothetical protein U9R90_24550 [Streptomyces sp. E11-3]|uniref:hypothetical protein n=1 Tax=Streptomyces sp. E11-3 TaxID=3110112 RepID=UPI00397FDF2E
MTMETLTGLNRRLGDVSQLLPDGMTTPLGCDAVGVPEALGPQLRELLPRVGCVYTDGTRWWWIVPSGSELALDWPMPARYAAGGLVPAAAGALRPVHQAAGAVPYTPPIPLYLALCRVTETVPAWMRSAVSRPRSVRG